MDLRNKPIATTMANNWAPALADHTKCAAVLFKTNLIRSDSFSCPFSWRIVFFLVKSQITIVGIGEQSETDEIEG